MSTPLEEQYRALLEKLLKHRAKTAGIRESYQRAAENAELPHGVRMGSRSKAKVLGAQLQALDFILARNKREIAAFGLDAGAQEQGGTAS